MGQKQNSFTPFEIGSRQRSEENTQALGHELNGFFWKGSNPVFVQQESYNIHHAQIQELCTQLKRNLTVWFPGSSDLE